MRWSLDTETTGLDFHHGCRPFMVTMCSEKGDELKWEWQVNTKTRQPIIPREDIQQLRYYFATERLVFHNIKFDIRACQSIRAVNGSTYLRHLNRWEDTVLMHHCLNGLGPHGLKPLCVKYFEILDDDEEDLHTAVKEARRIGRRLGWRIANPGDPCFPGYRRGSWSYFDYWLPRQVAIHEKYPDDHPWHTVCSRYGKLDAVRTIMLFKLLKSGLEEEDRIGMYLSRKPVFPAVYDMEEAGFCINLDRISSERENVSKMLEENMRKINRVCGTDVNPNSPVQVASILFDKFKAPIVGMTPSGKPSTNMDSLIKINDIAIDSKVKKLSRLLITHRKCTKTLDFLTQYETHSVSYDGHHKIKCSFNITGTPVTRMSCTSPNLQGIKKGGDPLEEDMSGIRTVFGPPPGYEWYAIDYRQMHVFIFSQLAGEDEMTEALLSGWDAHTYTAHRVFHVDTPSSLQRRVAKAVNFAFIYGASMTKVERMSGVPGLYRTISSIFPKAHRYQQSIKDQVKRRGWVEAADGYRIHVPPDRPQVGSNYVVQGTEARIVQRAMVGCDDYLRRRGKDARLVMQTHDDLTFEFSKKEKGRTRMVATLAEIMVVASHPMGIELKVDINRITDNLGSTEDWNERTVRVSRSGVARNTNTVLRGVPVLRKAGKVLCLEGGGRRQMGL